MVKSTGLSIVDQIKSFNQSKESYKEKYKKVEFEKLDEVYVEYGQLCIMAQHLQSNEFEVDSVNRFYEACKDFLENEVMQLKYRKSVDEEAMKLIKDTGFLDICELLRKNGAELTGIEEDNGSEEEDSRSSDDSVDKSSMGICGGSSKQSHEYLSSFTSEQTPLETLMEHIKDELGIEFQLEGASAQSQYSMSSVSSIATTIKTNPEQRRAALSELVEEYVDSFAQRKESAAADVSNTIEERNKTMGEIALALIAQKMGKSDQQLERIREKIKENRQKDHLQTELVIHNSVAHTDYQAKLSKEDSDKVLKEFSEGMVRLNNEFKKFGLSEVTLSKAQLEDLRDMYEKKIK